MLVIGHMGAIFELLEILMIRKCALVLCVLSGDVFIIKVGMEIDVS